MLYEMLTRDLPHIYSKTSRDQGLQRDGLANEYISLSVRSFAAQRICRVVLGCVEHNPTIAPTVSERSDEVEQALRESDITARFAPPVFGTRRRRLLNNKRYHFTPSKDTRRRWRYERALQARSERWHYVAEQRRVLVGLKRFGERSKAWGQRFRSP